VLNAYVEKFKAEFAEEKKELQDRAKRTIKAL